MAMLCMAVSLVSCSGEDGETGPQGPAGAAGVAGTDGADGADGISCWDLNGNGVGDAEEDVNNDGNFDAMDCQGADGADGVDGVDGADGADGADGVDGNANVQEHIFDISGEDDYSSLSLNLNTIVDNPSNYAFLYYIETPTGLKYSIPGSLSANVFYARVWLNSGGFFNIRFHDTSDNSNYQVSQGEFDKVIVVAIELTSANKNSENIMAELKAAGVDTSDYNQVAAYLGLE
ncbi:hypothetical protein [Flagellimonas marinaquae]|uniref:hypothetical protein n=1 Tax=Flagellimonas marinaquae TaxID=254955 RepID=UPI0013DEC6FD|nr:hypothetical protein [Allomuricauda aquimarina]